MEGRDDSSSPPLDVMTHTTTIDNNKFTEESHDIIPKKLGKEVAVQGEC